MFKQWFLLSNLNDHFVNIWILCLMKFREVQDLAHSVNRSRISYVHSG